MLFSYLMFPIDLGTYCLQQLLQALLLSLLSLNISTMVKSKGLILGRESRVVDGENGEEELEYRRRAADNICLVETIA